MLIPHHPLPCFSFPGLTVLTPPSYQRNVPQSQQNEAERYKEGQPNSHKANDSKDERSIANKLAREAKRENEPEGEKSREVEQSKKDSTLPVRFRCDGVLRGGWWWGMFGVVVC